MALSQHGTYGRYHKTERRLAVSCGYHLRGQSLPGLSVAGARAGLAGERSGLFMEQVRIVKEMRSAEKERGRIGTEIRPRFMVWENVPGAFSSGFPKGEDFRIVLEEIMRIKDGGASVPAPNLCSWPDAGCITVREHSFSLAWRCLDAQYWGVAQRRKRIFLLADFAGFSAAEFLFDAFEHTEHLGG